MKKDFDTWNEEKKEIDRKSLSRFYHPREVWWCSLGVNVGFEQDGTNEHYQRPVLVIRAFSRHVCLVAPLTTSVKKNKYHFDLGKIGDREAFVIISQIRLVDTKRFTDRLTIINKEMFEEIRKTIRKLI